MPLTAKFLKISVKKDFTAGDFTSKSICSDGLFFPKLDQTSVVSLVPFILNVEYGTFRRKNIMSISDCTGFPSFHILSNVKK